MKRIFGAVGIIVVVLAFASTSLTFAANTSAPNVGGTAKPTSAANIQKKQDKLALAVAKKFSVNYEEVLGWRNRGYSLLDIKYAYTIRSGATVQGATIQVLLTQHANGKSWSDIAKSFGIQEKIK